MTEPGGGDPHRHTIGFGALPPLPDGFTVIYSGWVEHYMAIGPGEWESPITCDRFQARRWCFARAIRRRHPGAEGGE